MFVFYHHYNLQVMIANYGLGTLRTLPGRVLSSSEFFKQ